MLKYLWLLLTTLTLPSTGLCEKHRIDISIKGKALHDDLLTMRIHAYESSDGENFALPTALKQHFRLRELDNPDVSIEPDSLTVSSRLNPQRLIVAGAAFKDTVIPENWQEAIGSTFLQFLSKSKATSVEVFAAKENQTANLLSISQSTPNAPIEIIRKASKLEWKFPGGADLNSAFCHIEEVIEKHSQIDAINAQQIAIVYSDNEAIKMLDSHSKCLISLQDRGVYTAVLILNPGGSLEDPSPSASPSPLHSYLISSPFRLQLVYDSFVHTLDNEYILKFSVPKQSLFSISTTRGYLLEFSSHRGDPIKKSFWLETESQFFQSVLFLTSLSILIVLIATFLFIIYRYTRHFCDVCGASIKTGHFDCPFQQKTCRYYFRVVSGRQSGMLLPITEGDNWIGSSHRSQIFIKERLLSRRAILLKCTKNKVCLFPGKKRRYRLLIDGRPVGESRYLAKGSIVQIGKTAMIFELRK